MVGRNHGGMGNQEGTTVPQTSAWGQGLLSHLGKLFARPEPIGRYVHGGKPFGGTVGGVVMRAANVRTVSTTSGYFGDVPEVEQAYVDAPPPWKRL